MRTALLHLDSRISLNVSSPNKSLNASSPNLHFAFALNDNGLLR